MKHEYSYCQTTNKILSISDMFRQIQTIMFREIFNRSIVGNITRSAGQVYLSALKKSFHFTRLTEELFNLSKPVGNCFI